MEEDTQPTEVTPVPFPNTGIAGFHFPEDSTVINGWVSQGDTLAMFRHSWGIWTGLTKVVEMDCNGDSLRTFETWRTPEDLIHQMQGKPLSEAPSLSCGRPPLSVPTQLVHAARMMGATDPVRQADTIVFESVVYSPAAADYTLKKRLYDRSALDSLYQAGVREVDFPTNAITCKPVYRIVPQSAATEGPFAVGVWPGTPDPPQGYPEDEWKTCVYIDVNNNGQGDGRVDDTCAGPQAAPYAVYNLNDFIHFRITAQDSAYFASKFFSDPADGLRVGDYAVLVAMHVATREITRWTWQTFWWSPNPEAPFEPSNAAIAAQRPPQLVGSARHYAMAAAYSMVWPAQPETGGESVGEPVYAFNPYLEAPFFPDVFAGWDSSIRTPRGLVVNRFGVETNCMSCHILANYDPGVAKTGEMFQYAADTYISLADTFFTNKIRADFAWSVTASIYPDSAAIVQLLEE